jgi:2-haloacid dehalogenase
VIEAVVVDLGGVAARFRPERRLDALAKASGMPRGLIQSRIFDAGLEQASELGRFTPSWTMDGLLWSLNHRLTEEALVEAWAMAFEPDVEVLRVIGSLPVRRVILTNNGPVMSACISGPLHSLRETFEDIICSWQIGAVKPDPAAFARAAQRIGLPAGSLLLLDDSVTNVEAATGCGWPAERVEGIDGLVEALGKYPELRAE